MTLAARLAAAGLVRAPARTLVRVLVLAAAVALLGAMLLFIGNSLRSMTSSAIRSVPLDWQGPVGSYQAAQDVAGRVARQPGVLQASPAATAPFAQVAHAGPSGLSTAGNGSVLAVPPDYTRHIDAFRLLRGGFQAGGVVLDQQLAATLQAQVGDAVTLTPTRGAAPARFRVSGVALVTAPDPLFQPLDPRLGPAPAQPPANIALMPIVTFARTVAPKLKPIAPASVGSNAQPGAQTGIQWQVHAQVAPAALGKGSPSTALKRADGERNEVQRNLPGQVLFVDNLSDELNTAAQDALYADALYIMLAVPGALAALGVAYLAALGGAERDRRDLALLRARGASRRHLVALAAFESALVGATAGLLGAGAALASVSLLVKGGAQLTPVRTAVTVTACVLVGTAGAAAARLGAVASVLRGSVVEGRRSARRSGKPLWQRLYVDLAAVAVSGLIYWLTARTGFSAVINPDSNPTLSLAVYMFFAPALLWLGATLLLVRLRGRALSILAGRAAGTRARSMRRLLLASAARRGPAINRGLVVVGLLLAFGVSLGIFTATYDRQAAVDAQLTLGADVTVTGGPGAALERGVAQRVRHVPGVRGTTGVDHTYAYVGPDLQDTYGIDASTLTRGTTLRDSYFIPSGASKALDRLRSTRDGILVSKETISDYSLRQGDLVKLRVLDRSSGRFRVVPFHVVGIVQEFPSAPRDSFMVANLSYLSAASHDAGPNTLFVKAPSDPSAAARRVAAATRGAGVQVKDIRQQAAQTVSSITTVDLKGISRIEEAFTIVLAIAGMALFVVLAVSERRHELATMTAVGARLRDAAAFVWSEAALVLALGLLLSAGLGWLLSEMLVAMLQHVFDPPPDALAVPWRYLAELAGGAIVATVVACLVARLRLGRLPLGAILREP